MKNELSPEIKEQMRKQALAIKAAQANKSGNLSPEIMEQMRQQALSMRNQGDQNSEDQSDAFKRIYSGMKSQGENPMTIPANIANATGSLIRHGSNAGLQLLEALGVNPSKLGIPQQISDKNPWLNPEVPKETAGSDTAQAAQMLPGFLALMGGGGEAKGAQMLGKGIEEMPAGIWKKLADYASKYAKNVTAGAAAAPLFQDGNIADVSRDALTDPLNLALGALGPGFQAGSDAYKGVKQAFNRAGGLNSTEDVLENLKALKATLGDQKVPPGQIIKSPSVNWIQSMLAMNPGSSMTKYLSDVGTGFQKSENSILSKLIPEGKGLEGKTSIPEDVASEVGKNYSDKVDKHLSNALDKLSGRKDTLSNRGSLADAIQKDIKNKYTDKIDQNLENIFQKMSGNPNVLSNPGKLKGELQDEFSNATFGTDNPNSYKNIVDKAYEKARGISRENGDTIIPSAVIDAAEPYYKEFSEELEKDPSAAINRSLFSELKSLAKLREPDEPQEKTISDYLGMGAQEEEPSYSKLEKSRRDLDNVNHVLKQYRDKAEDAFSQGKRREGSIWQELGNGYRQDIEDQLSGDSLVAWKDANNKYKKLLVPIYNDEKLLNHALKKVSSDSIVEDVLKTGDSERPEKLKIFTTPLSPQGVGKLTTLHYTKPSRKVNGKYVLDPQEIIDQHNKLGGQTQDVLFSKNKKERNLLDNLSQSFNKDLYHFGTGENPSETILNKYVKTGAYERPDLTRQLMDVISSPNKGKLAALQATKGMKNQIDPKKLFSNINKLDPQTQSILYEKHPQIKDLFDAAFDTYHDDLYNFGKGNIPSDKIINHFIQADSPTKSNQLLDVLSPEGRLAVASQKISSGRRSITDKDIRQGFSLKDSLNSFNKMDSRTQNSLFRDRPDIKKAFEDLTHATGIYGDLNPMLMPRTGITVAGQEPFKNILDQASKAVSGGEKIPAVAKMVTQLLAKSGLGNLTTKYLMDPKFVERYLESRRKLERSQKNKLPLTVLNQIAQGQSQGESQ